MDKALTITQGYVPGVLGQVVAWHGAYYHANWNFGLFFEAKVASEMASFFQHYEQQRDGFWTARWGDRVEGAIAIDGHHAAERGAHLRWFIVSDAMRGKGVGNRLMDAAMRFCRDRKYRTIYLWTFEGLDAARHLYEKAGFRQVEAYRGTQWGVAVNEQRMECVLIG